MDFDLRGCEWYGAGIYRRDRRVAVMFRAQFAEALDDWTGSPEAERLAARLPRDVLAAWAYRYDPQRLVSRIERESRPGDVQAVILGIVRGLMPGRELRRDVLPFLCRGGAMAVMDLPGLAEYPLPAVGAAFEVSDPAAVESAVRQAVESLRMMLSLRGQPEAAPDKMVLQDLEGPAYTIEYLRIGGLAGGVRCPYLQKLELAWTVADDALIVATHHAAVREMILARTGRSPRLALAPTTRPRGAITELIVAEPGRASWLLRRLLAYIRQQNPEYFGDRARLQDGAPESGALTVADAGTSKASRPARGPAPAIVALRQAATALAPFGQVCYYLGQDGPKDVWAVIEVPLSHWP